MAIKTVFKNFERIAAIAHALRTALAKPDWDETARLIREEWSHRRKNAPGITTELIDRLIASAKKAGGKAAKVCGAGGGGCVFFLVEPGSKERVQQAIAAEGAEILDVKVAAARRSSQGFPVRSHGSHHSERQAGSGAQDRLVRLSRLHRTRGLLQPARLHRTC